MTTFPISGVETFWWLPVVVMFVISSLTSTGGVSGAFLLLPFQMSVLGFTGPAVSPTNLLYNVVATPGGIYGYMRERRMLWPLAGVLIAGVVPGGFIGALARIYLLPDPGAFKLFVAIVLAFIGARLLLNAFAKTAPVEPAQRRNYEIRGMKIDVKRISFEFQGRRHQVSVLPIFLLSFVVGIVGAAYGIGGGAIIAPFLVSVLGVPVYVVAGPALATTFTSSVAGVLAYTVYSAAGFAHGVPLHPDWPLGLLFGLGGALGTYAGSRLQKFVPARAIKLLLVAAIAVVVVKYVLEFAGV
ncbi:MAG: hypothetical protein MAG453_00314 [Calditrichaeota bacterium]|nr:hypothetical protein [Calditrichota bacterium]